MRNIVGFFLGKKSENNVPEKKPESSNAMQKMPEKKPEPARKSFRNPYLNFMRDFRKDKRELKAVEIVRQGAARWRLLPHAEKLKYIKEAHYAPKRKRKLKNRNTKRNERGRKAKRKMKF